MASIPRPFRWKTSTGCSHPSAVPAKPPRIKSSSPDYAGLPKTHAILPLNAHLASSRGLELDHAIRHRRGMRSNQFNECRLGCLLWRARNSVEPLLQPHIVQPQWMGNRIHTVLPGQLHRSLPKSLRQLLPMRLRVAKLIQLPLQLLDWTRDGQCAFAIQYQPTSTAD